jgi:hypothetical protein
MGVTFMVPLRNTLRASLAKQSEEEGSVEDMTGGLAGLQGCASVTCIWEGGTWRRLTIPDRQAKAET